MDTRERLDHDYRQYRYSRTHATVQLLDAIRGIAPVLNPSHWPYLPAERPACGEPTEFAGIVMAWDVRCEVTCPKCRALMRAARPESAPVYESKFELKPALNSLTGEVRYYQLLNYFWVGGEPVSRVEFEERLARP